MEAKLTKIRNDVLFDAYTAEQAWQARRILLEKELAETKKQSQVKEVESPSAGSNVEPAEETTSDNEINDEAARIAAEVLAEAEDDDGIEGLFESLPQTEIDPTTGQSQTVMSSADGVKTIIRDFGKWTGVTPRKALDDACRSRYSRIYQQWRGHD